MPQLRVEHAASPSALAKSHCLSRVARAAQPASVVGIVRVKARGEQLAEVGREVVGVSGDAPTQDAQWVTVEHETAKASMAFAVVVTVSHRIAALAVGGIADALALRTSCSSLGN